MEIAAKYKVLLRHTRTMLQFTSRPRVAYLIAKKLFLENFR